MSRKHIRGAGAWLYLNTTSELNSGRWLNSHPGRFTHGERIHSTHKIGGWDGPTESQDFWTTGKYFALVRNRTPNRPPYGLSHFTENCRFQHINYLFRNA
jgi:hypothetical protein